MQNQPLSSRSGPARLSMALLAGLWLLAPVTARAQSSSELRQVLERLQRLEEANRELAAQVQALRSELGAARQREAGPALADEKLSVLENRVEEQAQTKVESSQRFPIRLTGMALFNAFLNSRDSGGARYPTAAEAGYGRTGGATLRQSVIGLEYRGPETVWGGKVHGSLLLDLYGGSGQSLDQLVRLRTASVTIDWKQRSFLAGMEKPMIAPREPNSLAQVGVSPLTGAGNLWLWMPQVRFEQGVQFAGQSGLRAQIAVVQTHEQYLSTTGGYTPNVEPARPGLEGRFEFHAGSQRRIEIAPGFHTSTSHVNGYSVPSNLVSLDWLARPWRTLEFTGTLFSGQNVAPLGTGGAGGGFAYMRTNQVLPVHSRGGWGQLTYRTTQRLSFNLFSGQQDNRNRDLPTGANRKEPGLRSESVLPPGSQRDFEFGDLAGAHVPHRVRDRLEQPL